MSRRRQRSAAYRARRAVRQRYVPVCVSDIVTVTIGPLTACTFPVNYQLMAYAAGLPESVMFGDNTTELSTDAEVEAFFGVADRVLKL